MVQKCTFIAWERHQFCRSVCLIDERRCWSVFKQTDRVSACLRIGLWWTVQMCAVSVWHLHHHQGGDRVHRAQRSGPRSPGHREHRDIPFEEWADRRNNGELPDIRHCFKLQRMGNRIKQIPRKLEAVLPDASTSRASKQTGISHPQAGFN